MLIIHDSTCLHLLCLLEVFFPINTARRAKAPLHPVPVITQPWKKIAMDVVQPLSGLTKTTKGNRFILTIMDSGIEIS